MTRLHPPTPSSTTTLPPVLPAGAGIAGPDAPLADRVRQIIELIRPAVQADGGDIEFVGLTPAPEILVQIRMHGACVGCPSSTVTLQTGIERNLRVHVPEVKGIQVLD